MAVSVMTKPAFEAGTPYVIFSDDQLDGELVGNPIFPRYDVASDGQRFVMIQQADAEKTPTITVVENWASEFEGQR
jgi:hypothetical protein